MITINEIKYTRRFNLGNYEHEEITVSAILDEGEDGNKALQDLIEFVNSKGASGEVVSHVTERENIEAKVEKKSEKKIEKKKLEAVKEPTEEVVEEKAEEIEPTPEPEKKTEAAPTPAKKTKVKAKGTKYDRTSDLHKNLVTKFLDDALPTWKSKASIAKETSVKMDGMDFLDSDGHVLKAFRVAFLRELGLEIE